MRVVCLWVCMCVIAYCMCEEGEGGRRRGGRISTCLLCPGTAIVFIYLFMFLRAIHHMIEMSLDGVIGHAMSNMSLML